MKSKPMVDYAFTFFMLSILTLLYIDFFPPKFSFPKPIISQTPVTSSNALPLPMPVHIMSTKPVHIAPPAPAVPVEKVSSNSFQAKILNPILKKLNLYSPAASNLLLGTAIQESLIGKSSKNIFQISLTTAKDINANYLAKHPKLKSAVEYLYYPKKSLQWNLEHNVNYQVAIARIIYLKANQPLPNASDTQALANFWKVNFNTYYGKGTAHEYVQHFENFLLSGHHLATQMAL